jgi:hypothetical protein
MQSSDSAYIAALIAEDSGLRLLRSKNPAPVISFLFKTFRERNLQTINADRFETLLADFLRTQEFSPFGDADSTDWYDGDEMETQNTQEFKLALQTIEARSHFLANKWCSEKTGYIKKYYNERQEVIIELSAGVERLFTWLDTMDSKTFIGTESRFQDILHKLRELSGNTTRDPQTQIEELEKQKKELQQRINAIKKTGEAEVYTPVQMLERLREVSKASRELLSDFRQVEENFKSILADVYKKQSISETKGAVLGYALDANLEMKETPQGQTFDSFWDFLAADAGKNEINQLTGKIIAQVTEHGIEWEDTFLLHLKQYLHEAGRKIIDTNHSLTHRLNRVLLSRDRGDHRQLTELIAFIKTKAFELANREIILPETFGIQTKPVLRFPQARTLILPPLEHSFEPIVSFSEQESVALLQQSGLFHQFYIDENLLKKHIEQYRSQFLHGVVQFSLYDLIQKFPIEKGLSEAAAYFSLAPKLKPAAIILDDATEQITYTYNNRSVALTVPKIIFG